MTAGARAALVAVATVIAVKVFSSERPEIAHEPAGQPAYDEAA